VTEWSDRWPGVRKVPGILEPVLTAAGVDHDIKVYPDAGHGRGHRHHYRSYPAVVVTPDGTMSAGGAGVPAP
jgi:hypothetical protein